MENLPFINTTLSAMLYVLALWYPLYTGPLAFCSFIPLAYNTFANKLSWRNGIWWGILFWGGHFYAFLRVLSEHGTLPLLINCIPYALLVMYFTVLSTMWFFSMQKILALYNCPKFALALFAVMTTLYLYCIENYALWLFDILEGYPFSNPLLPLAHHNFYISLLPRSIVFAMFIGISIVAVVPLLKLYKTIFLFCSLGLLVFFNYCRITIVHEKPPRWLSKILVTTINPKHNYHYCHDALIALKRQLQITSCSKASIIIMPESTLPYCLNTKEHLLPLIMQALLLSQTLVIGSHYRLESTLYNCMYVVSPMLDKYRYYCKKHGVPFFERVPQYFNTLFFKHLFLQTKEPFVQANDPREPLFIPGIGEILPYICSDLFFAKQAPPKPFPILALCNDFWFSQRYFRQLMILNAQLKAYAWHHTIIYVSYYYNKVLSPSATWDIARNFFK